MENPPNRLDKALARDVPEEASLSRSRLARLIAAGAVSRAGEVLTESRARVAEGDVLIVRIPEVRDGRLVPEEIPLEILHEDGDLIVVNKPAGMVVHPAPGVSSGTLANALLAHCGRSLSGVGGHARPGIVHRIDKDTSGLLVAAKSDRAHHGLARQFETHEVERRYRAVVYGVPDAADSRLVGLRGVGFEPENVLCIDTQLARHRHDRQRQAVSFANGRRAVTRARLVEKFGDPACAALLDCWLETGRTHQIRVHLAHAGHGVVGDPVYGGRRILPSRAMGRSGIEAVHNFPRQALHAMTLGFVHPVTGEGMSFDISVPQDMEKLIRTLRN